MWITARTSSENVFFAIISQLFKVIILAKCVLIILELNWNQRLRDEKIKLNVCHRILTLSTQLQNRSFHVEERTRRSMKLLFFIIKYANFIGWKFESKGTPLACFNYTSVSVLLSMTKNHHLGNLPVIAKRELTRVTCTRSYSVSTKRELYSLRIVANITWKCPSVLRKQRSVCI